MIGSIDKQGLAFYNKNGMSPRSEEIAKIKRRYKNEWLLFADIVVDRSSRPVQGRLVAHSPHRGEIYDASKELSSSCIDYSGKPLRNLTLLSWPAPTSTRN